MDAVRCTRCGGTRWSLLPGSPSNALEAPCELCGGEMAIERRRPGAGPVRLHAERRRTTITDRIAAPEASRVTTR